VRHGSPVRRLGGSEIGVRSSEIGDRADTRLSTYDRLLVVGAGGGWGLASGVWRLAFGVWRLGVWKWEVVLLRVGGAVLIWIRFPVLGFPW
jgi:hypothetical protein